MMVTSRLGVAVLAINNANPIRTVRGVIQSRYRAHSQFLKATFDKGHKCAKCDWMLVRGRISMERPTFAQHHVVAMMNTLVAVQRRLTCLRTCTELCITYRIAETFRGRKLSQIGEKYDFRGENLCGLLASAAPKDITSPNFTEKTFANRHKTVKSFLPQKFPLYGIVS